MLAIAALRSTIIVISNSSAFHFFLGVVWENSHIIPKLKLIWDIFGKMPINFSYLIFLTAPTPPLSQLNKSVVMRGIIPRCWYVQDLPAVAARVQIDRTHAGDNRIEDILRRVMLRALVREQGWRNRHLTI